MTLDEVAVKILTFCRWTFRPTPDGRPAAQPFVRALVWARSSREPVLGWWAIGSARRSGQSWLATVWNPRWRCTLWGGGGTWITGISWDRPALTVQAVVFQAALWTSIRSRLTALAATLDAACTTQGCKDTIRSINLVRNISFRYRPCLWWLCVRFRSFACSCPLSKSRWFFHEHAQPTDFLVHKSTWPETHTKFLRRKTRKDYSCQIVLRAFAKLGRGNFQNSFAKLTFGINLNRGPGELGQAGWQEQQMD